MINDLSASRWWRRTPGKAHLAMPLFVAQIFFVAISLYAVRAGLFATRSADTTVLLAAGLGAVDAVRLGAGILHRRLHGSVGGGW